MTKKQFTLERDVKVGAEVLVPVENKPAECSYGETTSCELSMETEGLAKQLRIRGWSLCSKYCEVKNCPAYAENHSGDMSLLRNWDEARKGEQ